MYGDPGTAERSHAGQRAEAFLRERVRQIAAAGRLVTSERRAVNLLRAAARGTVLTILAMPSERDADGLSVDAREAIVRAIVTDPPIAEDVGVSAAANALGAHLIGLRSLTTRERGLLEEWLERIAEEGDAPPSPTSEVRDSYRPDDRTDMHTGARPNADASLHAAGLDNKHRKTRITDGQLARHRPADHAPETIRSGTYTPPWTREQEGARQRTALQLDCSADNRSSVVSG